MKNGGRIDRGVWAVVLALVGGCGRGEAIINNPLNVSPEGDDSVAAVDTAEADDGDASATYTRVLVDWPDVSKPSKRVGGGENDAAVIVGIEGYARVQAVAGAIDNALAWHRHLVDGLGVPVDRVKVLTDDSATKDNIEAALSAAAKEAGASGRVWFVFIGHGAATKDAKDGLLLDVDVQQTANSIEARGVRRSTAVALLETSRAQPVLVLDACFSGRTRSGEPLAKDLQVLVVARLAPPKRAVVLSAALSDQFAGGLPGAVRPAFSYFVLGGLRGWADGDGDGKVTAAEVLGFAGTAMKATIAGREQTPELSGSAGVTLGKHLGDKAPDLVDIVAQLQRGNKVKDLPVLPRLSTFKAPPFPKSRELDKEPYDYSKLAGAALPPTPQDVFLADVLTILQYSLMKPNVTAMTLTEADVANVVRAYVEVDWDEIPGYRPWVHKNFVTSLTTIDRAALVKEAYEYAKANGINDPSPAEKCRGPAVECDLSLVD